MEQEVQNLSVKLYEQAAQQAQQADQDAGQSEDDNVVDADYEEVKDDEDKK